MEREALKEKRIQSWTRQIEQFKILADINDPLVKKNFEDGFGRTPFNFGICLSNGTDANEGS